MEINENAEVIELVNGVHKIAIFTTASISIRNSENKFVYVNDNWIKDFDISPIGKTLSELKLYSKMQLNMTERIENEVKRIGSRIDIINTQNRRMLIIRAHVFYEKAWYLITIAIPTLSGYRIPSALGWSPDRAARVYGETIANRLQLLDNTLSESIKKAAIEINELTDQVKKHIEGKNNG